MDKVGFEPTTRRFPHSLCSFHYSIRVGLQLSQLSLLTHKPLVLGTPRGRYSSRAPDTDSSIRADSAVCRWLTMTYDSYQTVVLQFFTTYLSRALVRRLIIASPRVFHLKSGRSHTRFQSRLWQSRRVSIPLPPVWQTGALPIELRDYVKNLAQRRNYVPLVSWIKTD